MAARIVAAVLALAFLAQQVPIAYATADWYRQRSYAQEELVLGVARVHQLHPGKVILLDGVDDDLFWGAIAQRPFLFLNIPDVYLTPGSESTIASHPELDDISKFVLPATEARTGLAEDQIVVYRAGGGPLRNITHQYVPPAGSAAGPIRIDMGDPLIADRLGPGWYPLESGFRWMGRTATVRMPAPRMAGQRLYVTAICPQAQLQTGPLEMTITVDGIAQAPFAFTKGNVETTFDFPLLAAAKADMAIEVTVTRTTRVGADQRDLGLAFGRFEVK